METTYEFFEEGEVWRFSNEGYDLVGDHTLDIYEFENRVYHNEYREAYIRFEEGKQPEYKAIETI